MIKVRQIILSVFLTVLILSLAGCSSSQSSTFTRDGLPTRQYLVGGGFSIEYVAPSVGTVYWVEENTKKILETKSVVTGDKVEFGSDGMDPESVKNVLGIELKDAKFTLYFIPR